MKWEESLAYHNKEKERIALSRTQTNWVLSFPLFGSKQKHLSIYFICGSTIAGPAALHFETQSSVATCYVSLHC
nr:hypothetical protein Q903MT_gene363 [Picea sitchensis]